MKQILTLLLALLTSTSYSQYTALTTVYSVDSVDILVVIENYNKHDLRQQLADSVFYNYMTNNDSRLTIHDLEVTIRRQKQAVLALEKEYYTVKGELQAKQFSPRTTVLFFLCLSFSKR